DDRSISPIDKMTVLEHLARDFLSHDKPFECLNRCFACQQIFYVLADMVVEFPDAISIGHVEMEWQVRDAFFVLITKPWRLTYLLANVGNKRQVGLHLPLKAVEGILKFLGKFVSKVFSSVRPAGSHQVGDRTDVIPPSLHCNMLQVEPWIFRFFQLSLALLLPVSFANTRFDEARETVGLDYTYPVEVVVTTILLGSVRMENVRALQ